MMLLYLDASVVVAWMKGESKPLGFPEVMEGIIRATKDTQRKPAYGVIASAILRLEAQPPMNRNFHGRQQYRERHGDIEILYSRRLAEVTPAVIEKASELQGELRSINRALGAADAIHVATAMLYRAEYLWTFDKKHILPIAEKVKDMTQGRLQIVEQLPTVRG